MKPEIDAALRRVAALSQETKDRFVNGHESFATIILTAEHLLKIK